MGQHLKNVSSINGLTPNDLINLDRIGGLAPNGVSWFVDAVDGSNNHDGLSWNSPFLTMAKAFSVLESGDRIFFVGKIREQLTTPVQVFDVSIIGAGNRPRHADAAPVPTGGQSAATWTTPASGSTDDPLLTVLQQGWSIHNFVMAGHATDACVFLQRDAGAGDAERDASHFEAHGVRFASGQDGVEQSGGCYNVGLFDSWFDDLTGVCIKHTSGAAVTTPYRWQIKRNRFSKCGSLMTALVGNTFEFHDNMVSQITTPGLDTSGGTGFNTILRNCFDIAAADFDPVGGFTGHATDVWSNYLTSALETGLPAN